MFNRYYQGIWKRLPDRYNKMHVCDLPYQGCNVFDGDTIAVHEKIFALRRCCYQSTWVWNQLNSSYDIHHQANDSVIINNIDLNRNRPIVVERIHPQGNTKSSPQRPKPKPKPLPTKNPKPKNNLKLKPEPDSMSIESKQRDRY